MTNRQPVVPTDFPVKVLRTIQQKDTALSVATCGTCGRSWDDGISTGYTPAPGGRCPFEYYHATDRAGLRIRRTPAPRRASPIQ